VLKWLCVHTATGTSTRPIVSRHDTKKVLLRPLLKHVDVNLNKE